MSRFDIMFALALSASALVALAVPAGIRAQDPALAALGTWRSNSSPFGQVDPWGTPLEVIETAEHFQAGQTLPPGGLPPDGVWRVYSRGPNRADDAGLQDDVLLVAKGAPVHPRAQRAWAELVVRVLPSAALPLAVALALLYGLGRALAKRASWGVASAVLVSAAAAFGAVIAIPMQSLYADALGGAAQIPARWSVGVSATCCAFLVALSAYGAHREQPPERATSPPADSP